MNHYDQADVYRSLLKGLTDEELARMASAVYIETDARIRAKIERGDLTMPSMEQLCMFQDGNKLSAIVSYRKVFPDVSIREAKCLFEKFA